MKQTTKEIAWKERIYQIIDSFLVESKNQHGKERSIGQLNQDRHLAAKALIDLCSLSRQELIEEIKEDIEFMVIGYIGDDEERETAQNRLNTVFKSLLERKKGGK